MAPKVGYFLEREQVQQEGPEIEIVRQVEKKDVKKERVVMQCAGVLLVAIVCWVDYRFDAASFEVLLVTVLLYGLTLLWLILLSFRIRWVCDLQDILEDILCFAEYVSYNRTHE